MITTAKTHGHHTAATCLARAGDRKAAFKVYVDHERKSEWAVKMTDAAQRQQQLKNNFEATVAKCKGQL